MPDRLELAPAFANAPAGGGLVSRPVYSGPHHDWADTPVVGRSALSGVTESGPLVIEEYDSTTVTPPGWSATVDGAGNIVLERG